MQAGGTLLVSFRINLSIANDLGLLRQREDKLFRYADGTAHNQQETGK
jgi:hypothetical protein